MKVEDISDMYMKLGQKVFQKGYLRQGFLRALYNESALIAELKKVYGDATTMGGEDLKTGLMIVTKRLDSGSPWPIGNIREVNISVLGRAAPRFLTAITRCGRWCARRRQPRATSSRRK